MKPTKEYYREYYAKNKEQINANRKLRKVTERQKKLISEKNQRYREAHKEEIRAYQKQYREQKKLERLEGKTPQKKVYKYKKIVPLPITIPYTQKQVIEKLRAFPDCYLWNLKISCWLEKDLMYFEKLKK